MLSVGATTAAGFDVLALHWNVLTAEAKAHGKTVDRSKRRLVGLCQWRRQSSRHIETWNAASSTGSATSNRLPLSRKWQRAGPVGICNCTQCQRRTGATFAVGAFFPKRQISAIEGAH
jgi:Glutathione-dependent formaldehyde-activating enzyme